MVLLFNIVGTGLLGAIIGYFLKYLLDFKNSQKIEYANKKRKVYEDLIQSMNIFLTNRTSNIDKKDLFLASYSSLWLWAPDNIISKVGLLVDHVATTNPSEEANQEKARLIFGEIIIFMRMDLGFVNSKLQKSDYKFFSIN